MVQFFMLTPFVLAVCCGVPHINTLGFVLYSVFRVFFGGMELPRPTGPYKVGYTEKFVSDKGNFCAVYYPTESDILNEVSAGYVEGSDRIQSLQKGGASVEPNDPEPPAIMLEAMFGTKMYVAVDAQISKGPLPVLVFSHGLMLSARHYSVICCELASYGVIVIAVDHLDGSAGFTVNQKTLQ